MTGPRSAAVTGLLALAASLLTAAPAHAAPTTIAVTVDARGTVTHDGVVTVQGTVVCSASRDGLLRVTGVQGSHRTASGSGDTDITCGTSPTAWSVSFASETGVAFRPGKLSLRYVAEIFENEGDDEVTSGTLTATLVRAH